MAYIRKRETADGPRYDVRYEVNGKRHTETFRKDGDANRRLTKIRGDELAGLVIDPKGGERLFGPYADQWLKDRLVKGKPLTPATRQGYEALLRRNLRSHFDKTKLRQITPERVRRWHSEVTETAGADQAAKSYRLLRAILTTAVSDELMPRNPCTIKGAGIEDASERPMLETATVIQLAEAMEPRLRALVWLGGFVALRPGELLGLQRQDIDLLHRVVHVRREAHEITGQGRVITAPKSEAGIRDLPLPKSIEQTLREHLDAYVAPEPGAWILTRKSGLPLRRSDFSNAWHDACAEVESAPAGAHPHDLRHHALTVVAQDPNRTTKEVMAFGGHSSPVAALRYQHATEERSREIADHLDDAIAKAKRAPRSKVVHLRS